MTVKTALRSLAMLLGLVVAAGCAGSRRSQVTFHDPNMDFSLVQKVAVMPFANLTQSVNAAERVRDVFINMLQATGAIYALPPGEVGRGIARLSIEEPKNPSPEDVVALAKALGTDAVITGTVREYGEVRAGSTSANVISLSVSMMEAQSGRVVWSASSTKGGVGAGERLFGGGGKPLNAVTEEAVNDLLDKLFEK